MNLLPERLPVFVSTHAGRIVANRLTLYRVKRAAIERDEAIARAHAKYAADLAAIGREDRAITLLQARHSGRPLTPSPWAAWPLVVADLRRLAGLVHRG